MPRYADPLACPDCSARLPVGVVSCPRCGLSLQDPLAAELLQTLVRADEILVRLRAASAPDPSPQPSPEPSAPYPAPYPAPRRPEPVGSAARLSSLSVPRILLGLGALCLLVAAVIFLAVAWSWLGVGGRTAVLGALTLLALAVGTFLRRRHLPVAAEALVTVGLGLLALDVVGASDAGWLGDLSAYGVVCAVGAVVLLVALALAVGTGLRSPQVAAVLALSVLGLGAAGAADRPQLVATVVLVAHAGLAAVTRLRPLVVLLVATAVGGAAWWCGLALSGLDEASAHASLRGLWLDGHGLALLASAVLVLLPVPFVRSRHAAVEALLAGSASMLTVTVAMPGLADGGTSTGVVSVAALAVWTGVAVLTPPAWRWVARVPMSLAALPVIAVTAGLAAQAAVNAVGTRVPFSQDAGVRLGDPTPIAAPVLLVVSVAALLGTAASLGPRALRAHWPWVAPAAVWLAATGTLALYPVPAWSVAGALAVVGTALVAGALLRPRSSATVEATVGAGVVAAALVVSLPSDVLTTLACGLLVALATAAAWRGGSADVRTGGMLLLPAATAGLLWAGAAVAGVEPSHRALPVLLGVGLLALVRPRPEVEISSSAAAVIAAVAAISASDRPAGLLAVHLTVAGVLVSVSALVHPARRRAAWLGGSLLAAATWVRLAEVGVEAPEPYTLPSAVALLLVGLHHLRTHPEASTVRALTPGLLLAITPSLLWVLADPVSTRAVLLGAACLVVLLLGATLRWTAPLVVGGAALAVLVLREVAPYAARTPQWVLIGIAGTLLTVVGVTWEQRLKDMRQAATYLGRLR